MLKIDKTVLPSPEQWQIVIEGMRNPMNSWGRMDSTICPASGKFEDCTMFPPTGCPRECDDFEKTEFCMGASDYDLMKRLAAAGSEHAKYRRMLPVWVTITAPRYWWTEYDCYKVGTVANSCSTMHRLMQKPFEMSDFSFDRLPGYKKEIKQFRPEIDEEKERWKKIDADYDVSDQGRIRHGKRILSGSVHRDNYILVTLHGKQRPIHRYVASAFVPNPADKPEVNHKDGNKMNNAAENLEWVTSSENQKHAVENGLQPKPGKTYEGKFTAEQRAEIKRVWDSGVFSKRRIAKEYGVSHSCICSIVNDKYKYAETVNLFEEIARPLVDTLNELRDSYLACDDADAKKRIWYAMIQLLPQSYNQRRTLMLNYEVLAAIYRQRKDHKLAEWHTFCEWIETLPYAELIVGR